MKRTVLFLAAAALLGSCSPSHKISRSASKTLFTNHALASAHIGISVYQPKKEKQLYSHAANKYFVPASNVKIATCYAALKYLGKNLPGILYRIKGDAVWVQPTGDPTFLHPDFERQRVYDFLKHIDKKVMLNTESWQEERWGNGWAWNDYGESYMAERSPMPIYGNVVRFSGKADSVVTKPAYFSLLAVVDAEQTDTTFVSAVERDINLNRFFIKPGGSKEKEFQIPFVTKNNLVHQLLSDTLGKPVINNRYDYIPDSEMATLHSQPTDSMLKPMMHNSDNFFAEQALLMVSKKVLGVMNDEAIIDTLLKTDLKYLPQPPHWVDGSGLSRYNLFTPQDFVVILTNMQKEFGLSRVKEILPAGNEGTLRNYYVADSSYVWAKTGTLSGVVALSGYLTTHKNKELVFSILVNNHHASATEVRRAIEQFLTEVRRRF